MGHFRVASSLFFNAEAECEAIVMKLIFIVIQKNSLSHSFSKWKFLDSEMTYWRWDELQSEAQNRDQFSADRNPGRKKIVPGQPSVNVK